MYTLQPLAQEFDTYMYAPYKWIYEHHVFVQLKISVRRRLRISLANAQPTQLPAQITV